MSLSARFERDCRLVNGWQTNMPRRGPPWSMRTDQTFVGNCPLYEMAAGPSAIVVAGNPVSGEGTAQPLILRSTDGGATWTRAAAVPSAGGDTCRGMAYGNGRFACAVGLQAFTSIDGNTWANVGVIAPGLRVGGYFGGGVHVVLPNAATPEYSCTSSTGGLTWTQSPALPVAARLNGGCYADGLALHVAVGAVILTGPNGLNWTQRVNPQPAAANSAAWSSDLGLVVVAGNGYMLYSTDAINWNTSTLPAGSAAYNFMGVIWTGSQFVACGQLAVNPYNPIVLISADGLSWREYGGYPATAKGGWGMARASIGRVLISGQVPLTLAEVQVWGTDYLA